MIIRLIILILIFSLALTACSFIVIPKKLDINYNSFKWNYHQQQIRNLIQYKVSGTFFYLSDQRKVFARFLLQKNDKDNCRLILINPINNSKTEINILLNRIQLVNNRGKFYISDNLEEIMKRFTGICIPVNIIHQWILGLPGIATSYKLDDKYYLKEINYIQNDRVWKVIYNEYYNKITPAMPSNIEIIENNHYIRLRMNNWILK